MNCQVSEEAAVAKIKDRCGGKTREEKYITLRLAGPEDAGADRCCPIQKGTY